MPAVETASFLEEKILARTAVVGVVGLGYVGLPLVSGFARNGFSVLGFDIDPEKVSLLEANRSYIAHFPDETLEELHRDHRFVATTDFSRLKECDAIIVCVPTPLTSHREPDLSYTFDMLSPRYDSPMTAREAEAVLEKSGCARWEFRTRVPVNVVGTR